MKVPVDTDLGRALAVPTVLQRTPRDWLPQQTVERASHPCSESDAEQHDPGRGQ